jgi:hypothetical protein
MNFIEKIGFVTYVNQLIANHLMYLFFSEKKNEKYLLVISIAHIFVKKKMRKETYE